MRACPALLIGIVPGTAEVGSKSCAADPFCGCSGGGFCADASFAACSRRVANSCSGCSAAQTCNIRCTITHGSACCIRCWGQQHVFRSQDHSAEVQAALCRHCLQPSAGKACKEHTKVIWHGHAASNEAGSRIAVLGSWQQACTTSRVNLLVSGVKPGHLPA